MVKYYASFDVVQDLIVEPAMPMLKTLVVLMGLVDKMLISRLPSLWRENVWRHAVSLLEMHTPGEQASLVKEIEEKMLKLSDGILMKPFYPPS